MYVPCVLAYRYLQVTALKCSEVKSMIFTLLTCFKAEYIVMLKVLKLQSASLSAHVCLCAAWWPIVPAAWQAKVDCVNADWSLRTFNITVSHQSRAFYIKDIYPCHYTKITVVRVCVCVCVCESGRSPEASRPRRKKLCFSANLKPDTTPLDSLTR